MPTKQPQDPTPARPSTSREPFADGALDEVGFDAQGNVIHRYETRTGRGTQQTGRRG